MLNVYMCIYIYKGNDRIYYGGRISRPARIMGATRFTRQNKHGNQELTTLKKLCVKTTYKLDALYVHHV